MKTVDLQSNYLKSIFLSGIYILLFIFFNIFISSSMFIFHIEISKWYVILSFIFSALIIYFFLKKSKILELKYIICSILLPILVIIGAIYVNGKFIDYTSDGNSYHKVTVGMLANGWNPLYEEMVDFDNRSNNPVGIKETVSIWGEHYAKASHIFSANIYALTGNIETGKCLNTISIIMLFFLTVSFLLFHFRKIIFSILFSICVVTIPVICAQYFTFYVDLLVYIYLFIPILCFFILEEENFLDQKIILFSYLCSLVIAINIKFSLFGYVGIFCLGYYIWYIVRLRRKELDRKYFITFTLTSAFAVIIGVFIVGLSVYPKNFVDHGHPFYPLMGKDKVDIMTMNQPDYFKKKNTIEKFIIATFSKMDNIYESTGLEAEYKIPFSIYKSELNALASCDARISGNGIFFSGIFIITIILLILTIPKIYKKNSKLFWMTMIPVSITIIMIFFLSESWWARYFPQLYFLIFVSLLYLNELDNRKVDRVMYLFMVLLLVNSFCIFAKSTKRAYDYTKEANNTISELKECKISIYTGGDHFPGAVYNIFDKIGKDNVNILNEISNEAVSIMPNFVIGKCE